MTPSGATVMRTRYWLSAVIRSAALLLVLWGAYELLSSTVAGVLGGLASNSSGITWHAGDVIVEVLRNVGSGISMIATGYVLLRINQRLVGFIAPNPENTCPACGYPLKGLKNPESCPECGQSLGGIRR